MALSIVGYSTEREKLERQVRVMGFVLPMLKREAFRYKIVTLLI